MNSEDQLTVVLVRHGESTWNKANIFTGWTDVELTSTGIEEAQEAGRVLKDKGYTFDLCFTSVLQRAITTFNHIAEQMGIHHIQGLNKAQTAQQYGEEQVLEWRRAYNVRPPALSLTDCRHPVNDSRYKDIEGLPDTESLEDTVQRVIPYWRECIWPQILKGRKVLVSAHGNSLRALVMHLDQLSQQQVLQLNIPTGVPLVYILDKQGNKVSSHYLMDQLQLEQKIQNVANQGKAH